MKAFIEEKRALAWAGCRKGNSTFFISSENLIDNASHQEQHKPVGASAERHSFLQYAMLHFRDNPLRCTPLEFPKPCAAYSNYNKLRGNMEYSRYLWEAQNSIDYRKEVNLINLPRENTLKTKFDSMDDPNVNYGGSMRGTVKILEYLTGRRTKRGHISDWTWKELTDKVKYSPFPIITSLLKLDSDYLNRLAVDSFTAIMRYMGDLPLGIHQREVECVYTLLVICHHHPILRDELYCQLLKQTTNNKSLNQHSSIRGWRLLAFVAAFFKCSDSLMPYLMKYLETAAQDNRRLEQETAQICIDNLKQTVKYGGRRNVPSESEVDGITEGKLHRQQIYFLPGGVQIAMLTTASSVVEDIIKSICGKMGIQDEPEFKEFSLYCIVEGDQYTMPLENDEYVLDLVAELERNENTYYLVFCRSVWNFELRLDSELYIDITFHQIVPDYLEGYLTVLTSHEEKLSHESLKELLRIATLLHRANSRDTAPSESEMLNLLPKPAIDTYTKNMEAYQKYICRLWDDMTALNTTESKAQCLEILQKWPLFGSCFFGIKMLEGNTEEELILAINKMGANVLDIETHETLWRFSFSAVHAPCNGIELENTTYADVIFGDEMVKKTVRLQVDHAHEVTRLIRQYEVIQQMKNETEDLRMDYPAIMIKV